MFNFKIYDWKKYKISLLLVIIFLCACSVYFVKCALAGEDYADSYFKRQIFGMIVSFVIMLVVSLIDYHAICQLAIIYYILGVLMAAATKFSPLGTDQGTDSFRWLRFGSITFQPSEVCKVILVIFLAVYFNHMREKGKLGKFSILVLSAVLAALPTVFILVQSDLSSSLVMVFTFAIMVLAAGIPYKILVPVISVTVPSAFALVWYLLQDNVDILKWYQKNRILGWLHPEDYSENIMWQQNHSVTAIASGKVYGKLILGEGSRNYIPVDVRESDFIFAVIGEEVGFVGSCIVIALLIYIIVKCLLTAKYAKDYLGALIATGISAMFMFQVFANIGVATSLLPNTGLPLPFLSYGLSSTVGSMMAIGLILNIGLQNRIIKEAKV